MILLIDAGNTRLKWRCLAEGKLFGGGQQEHHGTLSHELLQLLWETEPPPTAVWCVNVAGQVIGEQINRSTLLLWGLMTKFVKSSKRLGDVTNGYSDPELLGADRWMALVGASRTVPGACCVADCGSAVTVDCMSANHEHIGGLILPGIQMMSRCVANNTAQVMYDVGESSWLGRDTASCLASGAVQSIVGALLRTAEYMQEHSSSPVLPIITGGDAPQLLPWLGEEWIYEPDLIFIGLAAVVQLEQG